MTKDKQLKFVEEEIIDEEEMGVSLREVGTPSTIKPEQISLTQMMEMAKMLAKSTIVPLQYQNREENVFLALDMSNRMGISVMNVMQNMYIVQSKPSFSGSFISALIKSSPLFSDVEVIWVGERGKEEWGCYIQAVDNRTGKTLKGVTVDIKMVKMEGWDRNPKWKSLTELMLQYRAWSFFGRTHASELLNGVYDMEEMNDIKYNQQGSVKNPYQK